jgi:hypothetical protein
LDDKNDCISMVIMTMSMDSGCRDFPFDTLPHTTLKIYSGITLVSNMAVSRGYVSTWKKIERAWVVVDSRQRKSRQKEKKAKDDSETGNRTPSLSALSNESDKC